MRFVSTRHRDILIQTLYVGTAAHRIQPSSFVLPTRRFATRPAAMTIGSQRRDIAVLRDSTVISVKTTLSTTLRTATLLSGDIPVGVESVPSIAAILSRSDFDIFPMQYRHFAFKPLRPEPRPASTLFGEAQPENTTRMRLARVVPLAPPPDNENGDLEERLRWILTPPINEVLSDPQLALPETPFPFQLVGIKWLYDRRSAILADEMGLGKTMQAILAARLLWREGEIRDILIICPKSLLNNWRNEIAKWWPNAIHHTKIYGTGEDRQWFLRLATDGIVAKIINYEALPGELDALRQRPIPHDLVIIDEAQRIKNAESKTAQAVKLLRGTRSWALTGTPIENKIEDLESICQFINPTIRTTDNLMHLGRDIRPFLLRRRSDDADVNIGLPDRIDQDIAIDLDEEQRAAYDRAERDGVIELNNKGDQITITHVFQLIQRLRQICNFEPLSGKSAKLDLFNEDFEEIRQSERKAILFSQFTSDEYGLKKIAKLLAHRAWRPLQMHGEISPNQRDAAIHTFQTDPSANLLLLNYKVGGVGLNLQAANYVYLFDRWWNPAVEDQAVKRAHRIGQKGTVFVRRFYCRDTIEERILKKLEEKRRLFSAVIDENRPAEALGLSEEEMFSLFNITVRPPRRESPGRRGRVDLRKLSPADFEKAVGECYVAEGYDVAVIGGSHDGGIDIVATRHSAGGRDRIAIQCKRQVDNIGRPIVQQCWGVVSADSTFTRCDIVTISGFTKEAIDFAAGKRITLVDGRQLVEWIRRCGVAEV